MMFSSMLSQNRLYRWLPLIFLGMVVLALFHRVLFGEALFWGLPSLQFIPWRQYVMDHGPVWNTLNGGGAPLIGNYQSAFFYPPHLLAWLIRLPAPTTISIMPPLHLIWAGLGVWLLCGALGFHPGGRAISTLAYPLATTLVARAGTLPMIEAAAWLPWLVFCAERLCHASNARITRQSVIALALATGMVLLVGHAQWAAYGLAVAVVYMGWRALAIGDPKRVLVGLGALGIGLALSLIQLAPTRELQRISQRAGGVDEQMALNFFYSPYLLPTFLAPDFFGNPGNGSYVLGGVAYETTAYIGAIPLILTFVALSGLRRKKSAAATAKPFSTEVDRVGLTRLLAAIAAISFVFALGQETPIYPLFYRYVPGFNLFQAPSRFLLITVFALALLAGLAITRFTKRARRRGRLGLAGAIAITLVGFALSVNAEATFQGQVLRGLFLLGLGLLMAAAPFAFAPLRENHWPRWYVLVLALLATDLYLANHLSNPTIRADFFAPRLGERTVLARPPKEVADVSAYFNFGDYWGTLNDAARIRTANLPNMNLLDDRPMLNNFDPLRPKWHDGFMKLLDDPAIYENATRLAGANGAPRWWLTTNVQIVGSPEEAEMATRLWLAEGDFDPAQKVIIELDETYKDRFRSQSGTTALPVHIAVENENTKDLMLTLSLKPEDAENINPTAVVWLVLTDTFYPGNGVPFCYQACGTNAANGRSFISHRANMAFMAIPLRIEEFYPTPIVLMPRIREPLSTTTVYIANLISPIMLLAIFIWIGIEVVIGRRALSTKPIRTAQP
jgi:hypothetical protein